MNKGEPQLIDVNRSDGELLVAVAEKMLGPSTVAATNARRLRDYGFDPSRINALIPFESVPVAWRGFIFKKVEADPESPGDFGLFVRRSPGASRNGNAA